MKKIIFYLLAISISKITLAEQKGYELYGQMEGLLEGDKITMSVTAPPWEFERRDSAYVKNGTFKITGIVPNGPRLYWLEIERVKKIVMLMINNGEHITVRSQDINQIGHSDLTHFVTVEGSKSHVAYWSLTPSDVLYFRTMDRLNANLKKIKDSVGFDKSLVTGIIMAKQALNESFAENILNTQEPDYKSAIPADFAGYHFYTLSGHSSLIKEAYDNLNDEQKNGFYGKNLKEKIALCIGQPIRLPDLPDINGKTLELQKIIQKSKATILHLWAAESNTMARNAEQRDLKKMYEKYHSKGLEVIGISGDTTATEWKTRIGVEQYPWFNVSDLKGEQGVIGKLFHDQVIGEYAYPDNILVDSEGRIIYWAASGLELQWYLWKIFGE